MKVKKSCRTCKHWKPQEHTLRIDSGRCHWVEQAKLALPFWIEPWNWTHSTHGESCLCWEKK